jgi:CheY-like chemotaxis protein
MATVLIIDDDNSIRAVERSALEEAGYSVLEARDGAEALRALRTAERPLVALVDLMMPGVSGFELLQSVASESALARRHAYVVVTANATSLPVVQALRSSFVLEGIAKPFDLDTLLDAVDHAAGALSHESDTASESADSR